MCYDISKISKNTVTRITVPVLLSPFGNMAHAEQSWMDVDSDHFQHFLRQI